MANESIIKKQMQKQIDELGTLKTRYTTDDKTVWLSKLDTLDRAMRVVLEDTGLTAAYRTLFDDVRQAREQANIDDTYKAINALIEQMKGDIRTIDEKTQQMISTTRKVAIGASLAYLGYRIIKHATKMKKGKKK